MSRLKRTLTLGSVLMFGISYMTTNIVLGTFGILADTTHGQVPAAYIAASIAMLFTDLSYGRMAADFPLAGSAYTDVRKAIASRHGFIAGWAVLLDYLFLPMANWMICAAYMPSAYP
ncbi:amino acid permease, partial [Pseudomonas aeruginosa]|nr:amino acid permease [Pseudomonas aeruginosa]